MLEPLTTGLIRGGRKLIRLAMIWLRLATRSTAASGSKGRNILFLTRILSELCVFGSGACAGDERIWWVLSQWLTKHFSLSIITTQYSLWLYLWCYVYSHQQLCRYVHQALAGNHLSSSTWSFLSHCSTVGCRSLVSSIHWYPHRF